MERFRRSRPVLSFECEVIRRVNVAIGCALYCLSLRSSVVYTDSIYNLLGVSASCYCLVQFVSCQQWLNGNLPQTCVVARTTSEQLVKLLHLCDLEHVVEVVALRVEELDHVWSHSSVGWAYADDHLVCETKLLVLCICHSRSSAVLATQVVLLFLTEYDILAYCTALYNQVEVVFEISFLVVLRICSRERTYQAYVGHCCIESVDTALVAVYYGCQLGDAVAGSLVDHVSQRVERSLELSSGHVSLCACSQSLQLAVQTGDLVESHVGRVLSGLGSLGSSLSVGSSVGSIGQSGSHLGTVLCSESLHRGNLCGVGAGLGQSLLSLGSCVLS